MWRMNISFNQSMIWSVLFIYISKYLELSLPRGMHELFYLICTGSGMFDLNKGHSHVNVGLRCIFAVILSPNQHICSLKPVHILKFRFQLADVRDQRWVRVENHEITLIMISSACMMSQTRETGGDACICRWRRAREPGLCRCSQVRADLDYRNGVKFTAAVCDFCELATRHRHHHLTHLSRDQVTWVSHQKNLKESQLLCIQLFECSTDKIVQENEVLFLKSAHEVCPVLLLLPHSPLSLFSFLSLTFQIQLFGPFPLLLSSGFLIPVPDFSYVLLSATEHKNHDHRSPTSRQEPLRATNQRSSSRGEKVDGREVEYERNVDKFELDFHKWNRNCNSEANCNFQRRASEREWGHKWTKGIS